MPATEDEGAVPEQRDPTMMANQPALRTSRGLIWIVVGGIFAAFSLIPFGALVFAGDRPSAAVALTVAVTLVVLYLALIISRFAVHNRVARLRLLAVLLLSMAAVGVIGGVLCVVIEYSAA